MRRLVVLGLLLVALAATAATTLPRTGLSRPARGDTDWDDDIQAWLDKLDTYGGFADETLTWTAVQTFDQQTEDAGAPVVLKRLSDTGNFLEFYDATNDGTKAFVDAYGQFSVYYAPGVSTPSIQMGQRGDVIYADGIGGNQDTYIGRTSAGVLSVGNWGNAAAPGLRISNDGAASGYGSGQYWDAFLQIDGNNGGSLTQMYLTNTGNELKWSNDNATFYGALSYYGVLQYAPTAQTIAAGNTITADACGGVKRITSAGSVTTDTTNTFTAPAASNAGCIMAVCNSGSNAIALDKNALFVMDTTDEGGDGDLDLGADDCVSVGSDGSKWRQLARVSVN